MWPQDFMCTAYCVFYQSECYLAFPVKISHLCLKLFSSTFQAAGDNLAVVLIIRFLSLTVDSRVTVFGMLEWILSLAEHAIRP